mgnify:CR=1 FL=1
MAVPQMSRLVALSAANVALTVPANTAGSYVLGPVAANGRLDAHYVGRSDTDLAGRLTQHVGKYAAFVFATASSPMAAFHQECELFHEYKPTDNRIHPDRPANSQWKCPRCTQFG